MEPDYLECKKKWSEVKTVQAEVQKIPKKSVSGDDHCLTVFAEMEKRLKAELTILQERELTTLPRDKESQLLLLQRQEVKVLKEYKTCLATLREERTDVMETLKKSQEDGSRLQEINDALKRQIAQHEEASSNEHRTLEDVLQELKAKMDAAAEETQYFDKQLKRLLSRFSVPSDESQSTVHRQPRCDLKTLIGKLIEQSINTPQQPYITLDEQQWPDPVEFLLKIQAALQHPDDPRKIRVVPFHM